MPDGMQHAGALSESLTSARLNVEKISTLFDQIQKDLIESNAVADAAAGTSCSGVGCTGCGISDLENIMLPGETTAISGAELVQRLQH